MTTSSLSGKPDDYESRRFWTTQDWYKHLGAWVNEDGQLCFGSTIAFAIMLDQFHRTHTQDVLPLIRALEPFVRFSSSDETITLKLKTADIANARAVIQKAQQKKVESDQ